MIYLYVTQMRFLRHSLYFFYCVLDRSRECF